jgi:PPK2 family polyphosphate:nucleotide phosphotransferase
MLRQPVSALPIRQHSSNRIACVTMLDELLVPKGRKVRLDKLRTDDMLGLADKADGAAQLAKLQADVNELQFTLNAESTRSMLVVIQAMDAGGKDGTIRRLGVALNPAGVRIVPFKVPAGREAQQDYLWRIHAQCPGKGEVAIFNRSHYEDVVVVRVKNLVAEERWKKRFEHIVNFEQQLVDEGTEVVKIFLHISKEEQRIRQQERIDIPEKNWKFRLGDLADREHWDDFQLAYGDAISRTTTSSAPWYIVPSDRKWVRDVAVATILRHHLRKIDPHYPHNAEITPGLKVI